MLYDITLRDLSIVGTQFGVCLRLHGYREILVGAEVRDPDSFLTYMIIAKTIGYRMIAAGRIRTINAVEPPDDYVAAALADADSSELRSDDIMYRVANEYDSHQWMREAIRETLISEGARLLPKAASKRGKSAGRELQEVHQNTCLLSLWLALHDTEFANSMRQRMLDCLKVYRRAVLTVACTENLAYVRDIGPSVADLSDALSYADTTDRSTIFAPD